MKNIIPNSFVRVAFLVGIAILSTVFFSLLVLYVFPTPQYNDFCSQINYGKLVDENSCSSAGGNWVVPANSTVAQPSAYCDFFEVEKECSAAYNAAKDAQSQKAFMSLLAISVILIVLGSILARAAVIAGGLSWGGVLLLIVSSLTYWQSVPELARILLSGVVLLIVMFFAYKKFRNEKV